MEKEYSGYNSDFSKIIKSAGIGGIGEIVFKIFGFVISIIIARSAGSAIFGIFTLAFTITIVAQMFSDIGLGQGVLRFVAYYKGKDDIPRLKGTIIFCTKIVLFLSLFFTLAIFYSAELIAIRIFHDPDLAIAVKILIISLPFLSLGELWLRAIQSFQIVKYQVIIQKIFQPVIRLMFLVILLLMGLKLEAILLASVISAFAGFIMALFYLLKVFPVHDKLPHSVFERKKILNFSWPLGLTQFLGLIIVSIDSLMLGYFRTVSDVGIYAAATRVAGLVTIPLVSFNTIFAPMISDFYSRNEFGKIESLFKAVTNWIFAISLPFFLLLVLFAEPVMGVFGETFIAGAVVLIIFGLGKLIDAGVGSVGFMLTMTGRPKVDFLNSCLLCGLNIGLNYLLIPRYGIIGASIATGFSVALINILRLGEVYYILKMHPFKLSFLQPIVSGMASFFVVYLIKLFFSPSSLFVYVLLAILYVGLYLIFMISFRTEEDKFLNNIFKEIYKSNIKNILVFLRIENLLHRAYQKMEAFYFNKKYSKINNIEMNVKGISLKFSTEDNDSKHWFFPRYGNGRIHEEKVTCLLLDALKTSKCFVDVGTFLGYFTCLASKVIPDGAIYGFEMCKTTYELLKKNVRINRCNNVTINNFAVGDSCSEVSYIKKTENLPGLSLCAEMYKNNAVETVNVQSISLDTFFKDKDVHPDVCKIDVEGAEMQVLSGMDNIIKNNDVILFIEIHPENLIYFNSSSTEVICKLIGYGYRVFEIENIREFGEQAELRPLNNKTVLTNNTMIYAYKLNKKPIIKECK